MSFQKIWEATVKKNPDLADDATKIVITAASYKKALEQVYELARKDANAFHKSMEELRKMAGGFR